MDEVPSDRLSEMTTKIRDLVDSYSANRFIVSCRITAYRNFNNFRRFTDVEIADFDADSLFFQQGEITQEIEQILREMLADEKFIDGRGVLRAIEEQHGVLVSRADNIYSFSHPTLQEFLTAKHIVDNGIDIQELVTNHLCDRRWREVFLILAGLRRADELLLKMEQKINSLIDTPKLQNLLVWVEQVTDKLRRI